MSLRRRLSNAIRGQIPFEDLSMEDRRRIWPAAPTLQHKHVVNCRMLPDRIELLAYMPKSAACAEVGIMRCEFSRKIIERTQPAKLHLIDIGKEWIEGARSAFPADIVSGRVTVHLGDSATILGSMPELYFDWIYVDGDHSYNGVKRDLEASLKVLKPLGLIRSQRLYVLGRFRFL